MGVIHVFMRVSKMKNPQKNFKDFNEFVNLIAHDEEEEIPNMLSDEEVKKIVTDSQKKNTNFESENIGLMDEPEDIKRPIEEDSIKVESFDSNSTQDQTPDKQINLFGDTNKVISPVDLKPQPMFDNKVVLV